MNRSEQLIQLVGRDIEQDCTDYQGLQKLMQSLYQQLLVRNAAQIETLNQQINVLVEFIGVRAERRQKILTAFGVSAARPGAMKYFLARCPLPNSAELMLRWDELEQLVQDTKAINECNGKLLAMHNEILNQIIGNAQSSPVYSARYY